jgi:hypothetical protein
MHRPTHTLAAILIAVLSAVAFAASAGAVASSSGWTRISGPSGAGSQLGLARTADGVLHIVWNRGNTGTSIFETRLSSAGRTTGTSTVATGWNGNGGLALLAMPDKSLRLFTPGTGGINTFPAPETGAKWVPESGAAWGGAIAESAYIIGATLTKQGEPVTAWRGNAAAGTPPSSVPLSGYEGGMAQSYLATDAASGAVVLGGETNAGQQGGVYVQQILPASGARVVLPPLAKEWSDGLSGRLAAPGVYVAYADLKAVHLYRYGSGSKTLARGPFSSATVCASPDGRLWVAWGDAGDGLFATRSNRAAGAFEPVQKLKLPSSAGLTFLQCEGSGGPLDLFANDGSGFWHAHVLAQFSVHAAVRPTKAGATLALSVRDAGDPVSGATVTIGGRHLRTTENGSVSTTLRPGSYTAAVTASGYASTTVRVRA